VFDLLVESIKIDISHHCHAQTHIYSATISQKATSSDWNCATGWSSLQNRKNQSRTIMNSGGLRYTWADYWGWGTRRDRRKNGWRPSETLVLINEKRSCPPRTLTKRRKLKRKIRSSLRGDGTELISQPHVGRWTSCDEEMTPQGRLSNRWTKQAFPMEMAKYRNSAALTDDAEILECWREYCERRFHIRERSWAPVGMGKGEGACPHLEMLKMFMCISN